MHDLTAKRTLVKSPPELWSEVSEVERLAKHLGAFGEIRITKLEPEHTVAWEGEGASGTVSIEPSGWGTKVTLTAQVEQATAETAAVEPPPPSPSRSRSTEPEPEPEPKPGFFARLFGRSPVAEPAPAPAPAEPEPDPEPVEPEPELEPAAEGTAAQTVLEDALEALGSAHHRPFSRG